MVLITTTHNFLADLIGRMLKMDLTLSTKPEILKGRYTGKVAQSCLREGKLEMLEENLNLRGETFQKKFGSTRTDIMICHYRSDPIIPLL